MVDPTKNKFTLISKKPMIQLLFRKSEFEK